MPSRALFECVPNVSEGRDPEVLDACAAAIESSGATLAHRTHDAVHHRGVFTFFGTREVVLTAATALAEVTTERIDLRRHAGAHPRIGALDVLPFVPLARASLADAVEVARTAATTIWERVGVPSFLYGAAATSEAERNLADVRAGEFEGLVASGRPIHPSAGAIAIGARDLLVAFNVVLIGAELADARLLARRLRERNGGLRTLRVMAVALEAGRLQISCNLTDPAATPLGRVFSLISRLAGEHGLCVESSELIGLVPRSALQAVAEHALGLESGEIAGRH